MLGLLLIFSLAVGKYTYMSGQPAPSLPADGKNAALRVFLDGYFGGDDFFRTEIPYLTYVWDRNDADIHILSTFQSVNTGREYKIEFIGQGRFADLHFTLSYFSDRLATTHEARKGLVNVIEKGLMPFITRTELRDRFTISLKHWLPRRSVPGKEPWNSWIFSINLNASFNGQQYVKQNSFGGEITVDRITPELKISTAFAVAVDKMSYELKDFSFKTSTKIWNYGSLVVKSLDDHWSVGGWLHAASSTYNNEKYFFELAPAVEYNIFPYSEYTRKSLFFLYRLILGYAQYQEETIFGKTKEWLGSESFTVALNIVQPWGNAGATLVGSHYLHDFSKNRLTFSGGLSLRVRKGLSIVAAGSFAKIKDQLALIKGSLTDDQVLLQLKELSTNYSYSFTLGLNYSFGSSLSSAVNPRFSSGGIFH